MPMARYTALLEIIVMCYLQIATLCLTTCLRQRRVFLDDPSPDSPTPLVAETRFAVRGGDGSHSLPQYLSLTACNFPMQ